MFFDFFYGPAIFKAGFRLFKNKVSRPNGQLNNRIYRKRGGFMDQDSGEKDRKEEAREDEEKEPTWNKYGDQFIPPMMKFTLYGII